VAAIGIVGPSLRFTDELAQQYVTLCRDAAQRISTQFCTWGEPGSDKSST
jgi:DNA-binding IclR family transcriptional regulator